MALSSNAQVLIDSLIALSCGEVVDSDLMSDVEIAEAVLNGIIKQVEKLAGVLRDMPGDWLETVACRTDLIEAKSYLVAADWKLAELAKRRAVV